MATRKVPIGTEENVKKRKRVEDATTRKSDASSSVQLDLASFGDLNNDCLVHIPIYLPDDAMNSLAECSRDCRDAQNNESLNQTRTERSRLFVPIVLPANLSGNSFIKVQIFLLATEHVLRLWGVSSEGCPHSWLRNVCGQVWNKIRKRSPAQTRGVNSGHTRV